MPATASGDIRKSQGDLFTQPKVVPQAPPWLNAHIKSSILNESLQNWSAEHPSAQGKGRSTEPRRRSALRRPAEDFYEISVGM
jgi:hypothetical protein